MVRHSRHSAMDRASDRRRILQIMGLGAVGLATGHWSVLADDKAASLAEATASSTKTSETKLAAKATASTSSVPKGDKPSGLLAEPADVTQSEISDLAQARRLIADAREQMEQVKDYVCTFVKQERIGSKLLTPQVIQMKGRTEPHCIYFSFQTTHKGREAIYFPAKYSNKLVAHEGGWRQVEAAEGPDDLRAERVDREVRAGPQLGTVAGQLAGDDRRAGFEGCGLRAPVRRVAGESVDEDDRRAAGPRHRRAHVGPPRRPSTPLVVAHGDVPYAVDLRVREAVFSRVEWSYAAFC